MVGKKRPAGIDPHGKGIRIRIQSKGRRYTEILPGNYTSPRDLANAVRRRDWLKSRLNLGLPIITDQVSENSIFAEDAQRYLNSLTDIDYSTSIDYENILNCHWLPAFDVQMTQEITEEAVKKVLASLDVTQKRKRNILIPLRGVFEKAGIQPNPANIKVRRDAKRPIARFRPEQRAALMKALDKLGDPQVSAYFALLLGCGLRPGGEPLGLQWPDYDGSHLNIQRTIVRRRHKATTKTHAYRRVYVPKWVRPYLDALPSRFEGGWMFLNSQGGPYLDTDVFNGRWKAVFKTKAIKHDQKMEYQIPYVCRHTRAAELLSTGVEPAKAAKQMGHSVEMFFRTYSEWIDEYQKNSDEELEGFSMNGPKTVQKPREKK